MLDGLLTTRRHIDGVAAFLILPACSAVSLSLIFSMYHFERTLILDAVPCTIRKALRRPRMFPS